MKKFLKNYKQTLVLIASLVIGAIIGLIFKEKASYLKPFGDLFMNLMFMLIIPLIFLTLTSSIAKIKNPKRLGKLLRTIILVFLVTSLIALVVGMISTYSIKLVDVNNTSNILEGMVSTKVENEELNILSRTISAISTDDFYKLLSKNNIIALVLFSILIGLAINKVGTKAEPLVNVLNAANLVILKLVDIIFLYAPIGLGCYFAALIGTHGEAIAIGYLKTFIVYTIVAFAFYFIFYSIYAYIAAGKKGFKLFWKNILPATATSISTCSSAASIPINIKCSKNIGVPDDIAEATIPLGTSFHKDGSIIGSVFKIMFLAYLFGINIFEIEIILKITFTALIANLLVTAVPIGGGTISEMMIITMMNFPPTALPILTIIATIIDPPATMLNVVGDTSSSMLVARIIEGKNWLKKH